MFVIVAITLVAVIAVGVNARRAARAKDELSLVGSGAYVMPLLDMQPAHPTESVGT